MQAQRQEEQAEKERRAKGKASNQGLALQLHYKRLMEDEAKVHSDLHLLSPLLIRWVGLQSLMRM